MSFNVRYTNEARSNMKSLAGDVVQLISTTPNLTQTITQVVGVTGSSYLNVPIVGTDSIGNYTDTNILMFPGTTIPITSEGYDVFPIIGDINAVGYGFSGGPVNGVDGYLDTAHPQIFQLGQLTGYNNTVILATEALQHAENISGNTNHIGFGLAFARNYLKILPSVANKRKVLLVPCASSGSSFTSNNWNPGNTLYNTVVTRTNTAMGVGRTSAYNRLGAFLVHIGVQDAISSCTGSSFASCLDTMISNLRSSITGASNTTPFILGELPPTFVTSNTGTVIAVQNAIDTTPSRNTKCAVVSSANLISDTTYGTRCFNAPSQRTLGSLYLDSYTNLTTIPPKVYGLTFVSNTSYTITLSWIQNIQTTIYNIYVAVHGSNAFSLSTSVIDVNTTTLMSLIPSTNYDIYIIASNTSGNSDKSNTSTFSTGVLVLPPQVTGLISGTVTISSISLSWNSTINTLSYSIFVNGIFYTSTTSTSFNVTGLTVGTSYSFTVQAINTLGSGNLSSALIASTDNGLPTQVTGLTATAVLTSTTQISLTWNASTSSQSITYQVLSGPHNGTLSLYTTVSATSITVSALSAGIQYDFQIISTTIYGSGPSSSIVSATTNTITPTPVLRLDFSSASISGSVLSGINVTGSEAGTATLTPTVSGGNAGVLSIVTDVTRNHKVLARTSGGTDTNTGGYINITRTNGHGVNQTAYSLAYWVNISSFSFSNVVWGPSNTSLNYVNFTSPGIQKFKAFHSIGGVGGSALTDVTSLVANTWYHVVLTYDSTASNKLTFYVNGVQTSSLTNESAFPTSSTSPFQLCAFGNQFGLNGSIDYPQFWDVVLTASHVAQLYSNEH